MWKRLVVAGGLLVPGVTAARAGQPVENVTVQPLPGRQLRVCFDARPGVGMYVIHRGGDNYHALRHTGGGRVCRDVNAFDLEPCQEGMVSVLTGEDIDGVLTIGNPSPHQHLTYAGEDDLLRPPPECASPARYPNVDALETLAPKGLAVTDLTTAGEAVARVRLSLTCPPPEAFQHAALGHYEVYETTFRASGTTTRRSLSEKACPDGLVLSSEPGDRSTVTVAAILRSADTGTADMRTHCTAPVTFTYGGRLVPPPALEARRAGHGIVVSATPPRAPRGAEALVFVDPEPTYDLTRPTARWRPGERPRTLAVPDGRTARVFAVTRATVSGRTAFSEPVELRVPAAVAPEPALDLDHVEPSVLDGALYLAGRSLPLAPVRLVLLRPDGQEAEGLDVFACARGAFSATLALDAVPRGRYTLAASTPLAGRTGGVRRPLHVDELHLPPAASFDHGRGPFFSAETSVLLTGRVTPAVGEGFSISATVDGRRAMGLVQKDGSFWVAVDELRPGVNHVRVEISHEPTGEKAGPLEAVIHSGDRAPPGALDLHRTELMRSGLDGGDSNAAAAVDALLAATPVTPLLLTQRADVKLRAGRFHDAAADATRALELDARYGPALLKRAEARHRLGEAALARADVEQALALHPRLAAAFAQRGWIRLAAGEAEGAVADATRALSHEPKRASSKALLCAGRHALGRLVDALAVCNEVLRAEPQNREVRLLRAQVREAMGDLADAATDLAHVIEGGGAHQAQAHEARAWVRLQLGQADEALADAVRAVELLPQSASALGTRAWVRHARGELEAARADLAAAQALAPAQPLRSRDLGLLHYLRGEHAAAVAAWEKALGERPARQPVGPLLHDARERARAR